MKSAPEQPEKPANFYDKIGDAVADIFFPDKKEIPDTEKRHMLKKPGTYGEEKDPINDQLYEIVKGVEDSARIARENAERNAY